MQNLWHTTARFALAHAELEAIAGPSRLGLHTTAVRLEGEAANKSKPRARYGFVDTLRASRNAVGRRPNQRGAARDDTSSTLANAPYQKLGWGSYYNPDTFSPSEPTRGPRRANPLLGPGRKEAEAQDILHQLRLNPGKPSLADDSYKNGALLSNYITEMGKIFGRAQTGLTRKSQRSIGKAVRRARAMGILPAMARGGGKGAAGGWR